MRIPLLIAALLLPALAAAENAAAPAAQPAAAPRAGAPAAPALAAGDKAAADRTDKDKAEAPEAAKEGEVEDSTAVNAGPEAGKAEFTEALEAQRLLQWRYAAKMAWLSLAHSTPAADKYESAQYVLADALYHLGYTQAAAEYFFSVAQRRQTPALTPRALAGIEALSRRHLVTEDQLLRGVLVEAELATVPPDIADFLHYWRGISNVRLGYDKWSNADLGAIHAESHYGRLASMARAVDEVRKNDPKVALASVEKILAEDPDADVQARGRLMRARLLFDLGRMKDAISQFKQVSRTDRVPAGEILLERAWSHYRAGQYHDSMGLLYALGAPSNRDLFLPDQFILRGLIYERFCHFRAAKAAVADFRARYGAPVQALRDGAAPSAVPEIVRAAESLPEVEPETRIRNAVKAEKAKLKSDGAGEDGLDKQLTYVYEQLQRRADRSMQLAMDQALRTAAERLLEASEQANLLEYEVGVSIHRRISDAAGNVRLREAAAKVPAGGPDVYYPFDNEYWTDELPDMRFLIQDRCVE